MCKADSPRPAARTSLSRRGLLASAGAIAAAMAAVPALAVPQAFSPEFLEYRRRQTAWLALHETPHEETEIWYAQEEAASEAMRDAIEAVISRPVKGWCDVIERAHIVRDQLFEVLADGTLDRHSSNEELEGALLKAIFAMAEGGADV